MKMNTTQELIEDIRNGKMVVLVDDEDREKVTSWSRPSSSRPRR